ncbi:MAG TPA: hypothetical protein PK939_03740, partial [Bacteroidales bacterium]|nr:hypothetical protein [Bacteroidales bacterium]
MKIALNVLKMSLIIARSFIENQLFFFRNECYGSFVKLTIEMVVGFSIILIPGKAIRFDSVINMEVKR